MRIVDDPHIFEDVFDSDEVNAIPVGKEDDWDWLWGFDTYTGILYQVYGDCREPSEIVSAELGA